MGKANFLSLLLLLAAVAIAVAQIRASTDRSARQLAITGEAKKIEHQGRQREYRIHVPKSVDEDRAVPLVMFLHGGAGTAEQASRMGMTVRGSSSHFGRGASAARRSHFTKSSAAGTRCLAVHSIFPND